MFLNMKYDDGNDIVRYMLKYVGLVSAFFEMSAESTGQQKQLLGGPPLRVFRSQDVLFVVAEAMNMPHMMVHPLFSFLNTFSASWLEQK